MILAFVIITIAFIRSHKILFENRFKLLTFIYFLFATLYVYTFLADLGFVPAAENVLLISAKIYIVAIGIVIRLFITRPVPKSTIETYTYTEKTDDDDDEYLFEELLKTIREVDSKFRKTDFLFLKYFYTQMHELNLINENLDKILEKIGEEKIKERDDGYKEQFQGKVPQSLNELQEEMLKIYRNVKENDNNTDSKE